jgi:hypothetical protein
VLRRASVWFQFTKMDLSADYQNVINVDVTHPVASEPKVILDETAHVRRSHFRDRLHTGSDGHPG